ncbi:hypothetical protein FACS189487_07070 [Campylobacterota bacterium]|nr:hypothetical protein FACS189487_07070 [Campylobacterota bacterium]
MADQDLKIKIGIDGKTGELEILCFDLAGGRTSSRGCADGTDQGFGG